MSEYETVLAESVGEIEVKKSKFIARLAPVSCAAEAREYLDLVRNNNKRAKHNVHAFRLMNGGVGFSDDGEPQGTAGKPVMDALSGSGLVNVEIIVTRYFGGILLGTGGLVRAYGDAAKAALDAARPVTMQSVKEFSVSLDYSRYGRVSALVPEFGGCVEDTVYKENIELAFYIPDVRVEAFLSALSELTLGAVAPVRTGEGYRVK
ncbi:MAG: YigZ family protein [Clostridia bacterium]|nr:YigZ family protein [Clostridia bacterium]